LAGASLAEAHLEDAVLREAHLEGASLSGARLEGTILSLAHLTGADLTGASFDKASRLNNAVLTEARFDQVSFDNTNLTVVDWSLVDILGDERRARAPKNEEGMRKRRAQRLEDFKIAVRANRVLAVALQGQGLSEDAARFAYRAQLLQQQVLWHQRKLGAYIFARFLDGLAGYGYKPVRSLIAYLLVILGFAVAYWLVGPMEGHAFLPDGALVFSLTSFHGRGFFPGGIDLENWITRLAATEAVIGLLIEISFIATFTQRFFGAK
jgi:hypothetical protein